MFISYNGKKKKIFFKAVEYFLQRPVKCFTNNEIIMCFSLKIILTTYI